MCEDEKQAMPPRIIIGLTGPIGSGCSTLAKFFDDPDDIDRKHGNIFIKRLIKDGLLLRQNNNLSIDWDHINEDVVSKFHDYQQMNKSNRDTAHTNPEDLKQEKRKFKELGRLLEKRESLKSLTFLNAYFPQDKPHMFRTLSMSDIIIFRALIEIDEEKCSNYPAFNLLSKKTVGKIRQYLRDNHEMETLRELYKQISVSGKTVGLIRAFKEIHIEIRKLKQELLKVSRAERTSMLQEFGNNIRKCGNPFCKKNNTGNPKKFCVQLAQDMERVIHLIYESGEAAFFFVDCLKNPYEVIYFRQRFPLFYLLSLYAKKEIRYGRRIKELMINNNVPNMDKKDIKRQFDEIDQLDSGEQITDTYDSIYMQNVIRCVQMSDYSINNIGDQSDTEGFLHEKLLRLVSLILCSGSSKPHKDEVCMNMAYAMAVKSNCICRQVGAVIAGENGYIVGAGWNDVACGEISCGLRHVSDMRLDIHKALSDKVGPRVKQYPEQHCFCFKDEMAKEEASKKLDEAIGNYEHLQQEHDKDIHDLVQQTKLHQPEYCLALHGEENAVIQGAKIGGPGVRRGTIYVTAQPCTLCAKTIKQAGIQKVVYTDPYPKSEPEIFMNGITLEQFEGVKPRAYIRLFMPDLDQKELQRLEKDNLLPGFDFQREAYVFQLG